VLKQVKDQQEQLRQKAGHDTARQRAKRVGKRGLPFGSLQWGSFAGLPRAVSSTTGPNSWAQTPSRGLPGTAAAAATQAVDYRAAAEAENKRLVDERVADMCDTLGAVNTHLVRDMWAGWALSWASGSQNLYWAIRSHQVSCVARLVNLVAFLIKVRFTCNCRSTAAWYAKGNSTRPTTSKCS